MFIKFDRTPSLVYRRRQTVRLPGYLEKDVKRPFAPLTQTTAISRPHYEAEIRHCLRRGQRDDDRELPDMMSATEGGSWKSGRSNGSCMNFIV